MGESLSYIGRVHGIGEKRFGDLEIDTIIGKNHKGAILTINDRATEEKQRLL